MMRIAMATVAVLGIGLIWYAGRTPGLQLAEAVLGGLMFGGPVGWLIGEARDSWRTR